MLSREDALKCRQHLHDAIDALRMPGDAVNENYVLHCMDKARECMRDVHQGISPRWSYVYDDFDIRD